MNISPDGVSVSFKTAPEELFLAEQSGAKSNTVRILDKDEYQQLRKADPKKIIIQYQQEFFLRTLTNLHVTEDVFGKVIVVFSWTNKEHHHPIRDQADLDPKANTMHPDELSPVLLPRTLISNLGRHRRNKSHAEFISDLLDAHITRTTEEPSSDKSIALIAISKGMMDTLTNIANGRSSDDIIRELYRIYQDNQAYTARSKHD